MKSERTGSNSDIQRSSGTTESERHLAKLADRTFLNLWSYPNLYIDKKAGGKGAGKELCDLLVVCGDDVVVFSDKTIAWPEHGDVQIAWRRWYRRAVKKSVDQVNGALRWLETYPERIFLDCDCTKPLPISLPPKTNRRAHGVVVARGAGPACLEYFKEGIGSLLVIPELKGQGHCGQNAMPFAIGDVNPDGPFIHVLDDASLDIALQELDTVTDFTQYLSKKETLIRSGRLISAGGEEDLVAYFMTHTNNRGEHDFSRPDGSPLGDNDALAIDPSTYSGFRTDEQYISKKEADRISYLWDQLIEAFTTHMLAGTTLTPSDGPFDLNKYEEGVRHMALVPRYLRRLYAEAIAGALENGQTTDRFTRAFLPRPGDPHQDTGFFFMTLAVPDIELGGGYDQYRIVRRNMLECYALTFLARYPHLARVVGITTEPPQDEGSSAGSSEDLILAEQPLWTDDLHAKLKERQAAFGIAKEGNYSEYAMHGTEYPEATLPGPPSRMKSRPMNRKQRRAMKAKARRRPK